MSITNIIAPLIKKINPSYQTNKELSEEYTIKKEQLKQLKEDFHYMLKTGEINPKKRQSYKHGETNPLDIEKTEKSYIRLLNSTHRTKNEYKKAIQPIEKELCVVQMHYDSHRKTLEKKKAIEEEELMNVFRRDMSWRRDPPYPPERKQERIWTKMIIKEIEIYENKENITTKYTLELEPIKQRSLLKRFFNANPKKDIIEREMESLEEEIRQVYEGLQPSTTKNLIKYEIEIRKGKNNSESNLPKTTLNTLITYEEKRNRRYITITNTGNDIKGLSEINDAITKQRETILPARANIEYLDRALRRYT